MKVRAFAALSSVALASTLFASPPASADKPTEPAESGVVERFDTIGGHQVGPVMTDVGGAMLPILVVVGWDDAVTYCTDGPPVFNGVEQDAVAPSGNLTVVVHNSDIPILVFDVSAAASEEDFLGIRSRRDRPARNRHGETAPDHQCDRKRDQLEGEVARCRH